MSDPELPPVLYVEDEESDALLLKRAFRKAGVRQPLRVIPDGQQALDFLLGRGDFADRAENRFPCLVLLDLNLPRMSGLEILRQFREDPGGKETPVVVFSSSQHPADQRRATEFGADAYIVKPSGADEIVAVAARLRERWLA
jgi:CheY-like chemotaxis protein